MSKAVNDVQDLANHKAEEVAYPDLAEIPAKPAPSNSASDRKAAVQSLRGDQADAQAQTTDLQNQAAAMKTIPVPGQPAQPPHRQPPPSGQ